MAATIRHMEHDEPSSLRYEIAWVDNGSGKELTDVIEDTYEIEHALPMRQNTGLAYGMNLLIFNLCTAPYILLLEEDWLYLDELVAEQTIRRKHAIADGISLVEQNITSFDGRHVMGVFLRPETYSSFLPFPLADVWESVEVEYDEHLPLVVVDGTCDEDDGSGDDDCQADTDNDSVSDDGDGDDNESELGSGSTEEGGQRHQIQYQIFCSDPSVRTGNIWGSYTNGAGLYRRSYLHSIGRMYGEPGDAFHDRYVEGNYAYRAGLRHCHAALRLGDCVDVGNAKCTAAFYHIGGGRGTRPQKPDHGECASELWNFWGTPIFSKYLRVLNRAQEVGSGGSGGSVGSGGSGSTALELCGKEELQKLRDVKAKEKDSAQYREEVKRANLEAFRQERVEREALKNRARKIRSTPNEVLRSRVRWMSDLSDEAIESAAARMERLADSPHPLEGYWDSHGRPLK